MGFNHNPNNYNFSDSDEEEPTRDSDELIKKKVEDSDKNHK